MHREAVSTGHVRKKNARAHDLQIITKSNRIECLYGLMNEHA